MMMEGGALRRQAIARVGKGLRIFRPSQLDFGRQLSFSPYARAVESRCWPTTRRSLIRKNGSTWGIIPSGVVMCVAQKIGPIKASLIHWNGTTGEDLRRARGARPSIGWHDPWRAELCDLKQVFPRSPGSSPIHRL